MRALLEDCLGALLLIALVAGCAHVYQGAIALPTKPTGLVFRHAPSCTPPEGCFTNAACVTTRCFCPAVCAREMTPLWCPSWGCATTACPC